MVESLYTSLKTTSDRKRVISLILYHVDKYVLDIPYIAKYVEDDEVVYYYNMLFTDNVNETTAINITEWVNHYIKHKYAQQMINKLLDNESEKIAAIRLECYQLHMDAALSLRKHYNREELISTILPFYRTAATCDDVCIALVIIELLNIK